MEQEWCQSVTDATAVFTRIDRDLGALDSWVSLDEHKLKEFEMTLHSFEDDYSWVLFRVHALEQKKKEYEERIEMLEMGVAFLKSNMQVDAMRIQRLEECLEDIVATMATMSKHLCSCKQKSPVASPRAGSLLEYASDDTYVTPLMVLETRVLMRPVGELEVTVNQVGSGG